MNPFKHEEIEEIISPLDLKIRICYCCENPLSFNEYHETNTKYGLNELMKLWQNDYIELLCCRCQMRLIRIQKVLNSDPSLLDDNYSSHQMLQISRDDFLSRLKTIAANSDGRVRRLLKIIEALDF